MEIWRWVSTTKRALRSEGHNRLAQLVDELPSLVCDDEHARVEALVPEAVALARAARQPWVEVFVRHWALQSRVLHRYEAREHLAEAVSLLDFANREQTRSCPQSVCVTQDLAACYACADGPGYVRERLEVAAETLARIDPTWPCFECISEEYASALQDAGRHEEVLAWAQRQTDAAVRAGVSDVPRFEMTRAQSLLELGRPDEAWAIMEDHEAEAAGGASRELDVDLVKARVLVVLGRADEARRALPSFEAIADTPSHYEDYAHAVEGLVGAGAMANDAALGARLRQMLERAQANGAWFLAGQLAALGTRLAEARGAWTIARAGLDEVDRICEQLRQPQRVRAQIEAHRGAIERGPPDPGRRSSRGRGVPARRGRARARSAGRRDRALARRRRARGAPSPGLAACRLSAAAEQALRRFLQRTPGDPTVVLELGHTLARAGRHDALVELVGGTLSDELRPQGLWLLAGSHDRRGEADAAARCLEQLLELDPDAHVPRHRLATLERERGNHAPALAHLDRLVAELEPGDHDWDRMTVAAILGRWDLVRDSVRRLGLGLPGLDGEGPIDEPLGLCRVRVVDEDGPHDLYAHRRGPVTARVVQMAGPGRTEHFEDLVVFDAAPLDPPPDEDESEDDESEDDEDDEVDPPVPTYAVVHRLEAGGFSTWALDGTHPGEDAWAELVRALEELGGQVRVRSDERYRHEDPDDEDQTLLGVFAWACMPAALSPSSLHERLTELTAGWEHPLVWPGLAAALPPGEARERELARVDAVGERYDL